jgi:lactoylglutathione lyase
MIKASHLNHVVISVKDVEKAVPFYRTILELKQLPRPDFIPRAGAWFQVGDTRLQVIAEAAPPAPTRRHVCLEVEDFDEAIKTLEEKGVKFVNGPGKHATGERFAFLHDPEGNLIEIQDIQSA